VLAVGSEVFRVQFFGNLKGEDVIKTNWNYKDFKFFISTFYSQVSLKGKSLQSLCELFLMSDYYNVPEIKTAILQIIKSSSYMSSDQEVTDAALIARTSGLLPELSRLLYDRILEKCGTKHSDIEKFFNQQR